MQAQRQRASMGRPLMPQPPRGQIGPQPVMRRSARSDPPWSIADLSLLRPTGHRIPRGVPVAAAAAAAASTTAAPRAPSQPLRPGWKAWATCRSATAATCLRGSSRAWQRGILSTPPWPATRLRLRAGGAKAAVWAWRRGATDRGRARKHARLWARAPGAPFCRGCAGAGLRLAQAGWSVARPRGPWRIQ
jgi:hypothetical protein